MHRSSPTWQPTRPSGRFRLRRATRTNTDYRRLAAATGRHSRAALLLPRALWQRLGGFDEELFLYWEDTDLCWRIQLLGLRTVVAHDSVIVHQRNGSGGGSATWLHLYVQNGIYAHLKTQPWWRIIAFVARQLVALPWRLLRTGDRRLLTAFGWNLDRFGATLRHRRTLLGRK